VDTGSARPTFPLLTIWFQPRLTIRRIVDTDSQKYVNFLAALTGISNGLDTASRRSSGDIFPFPLVLIMVIIFGSIGGWISLYISGALLRWTGSWFGGQANSDEVRAAVAWASIPTCAGLAIWILEIAIFGQELFTESAPRIDNSLFLSLLLLALLIPQLILGLWSLVLLINTLAEVHRFSGWKAFGAATSAFLIIFIPLLCLVFIAIGFGGG